MFQKLYIAMYMQVYVAVYVNTFAFGASLLYSAVRMLGICLRSEAVNGKQRIVLSTQVTLEASYAGNVYKKGITVHLPEGPTSTVQQYISLQPYIHRRQ